MAFAAVAIWAPGARVGLIYTSAAKCSAWGDISRIVLVRRCTRAIPQTYIRAACLGSPGKADNKLFEDKMIIPVCALALVALRITVQAAPAVSMLERLSLLPGMVRTPRAKHPKCSLPEISLNELASE